MLTLLKECEAVVNSRPVTHMMYGDSSISAISLNMSLQELKCVGVMDLDQVDPESIKRRVLHINKLRIHV